MHALMFFFDKTERPVLYIKENKHGNSTNTGTLGKDTEAQVSQPFCTKDPMKRRNYNQVLKIFCTSYDHRPSSSPSAAVVKNSGTREREQGHPGQKKPHRPKASRRAATRENHRGTSAGDAPQTSSAMDPYLIPTSSKGRTWIHPPRNQQPEHLSVFQTPLRIHQLCRPNSPAENDSCTKAYRS